MEPRCKRSKKEPRGRGGKRTALKTKNEQQRPAMETQACTSMHVHTSTDTSTQKHAQTLPISSIFEANIAFVASEKLVYIYSKNMQTATKTPAHPSARSRQKHCVSFFVSSFSRSRGNKEEARGSREESR